MDFPILSLTIFAAVQSIHAPGAFLQFLFRSLCKAVPTQFAPLLWQAFDFNSIFFFDEFSHLDIVQLKRSRRMQGSHSKILLYLLVRTIDKSLIFQTDTTKLILLHRIC